MRAIGLVLACILLASHTRRVKTDFEQAGGISNDKGKGSQLLIDSHAASGSLLAAEQSLLQQKVESPGPLRQLALLLLILEPAAAFHLPGAARSFAAMLQQDLSEGAPLQSTNNGQLLRQDEGADYHADSEPVTIAATDDTWQVQGFGADSPADSEPNTIVASGDEWQLELDRALFSLDIEPRERLELLQSVLSDPSVLRDVQEALSTVKDKGFMVGHSEAIEKLFPPGTQSRADLEGLTALRKQVPEAFEELQEQVREQRSKVFEKMHKQMRETPTIKRASSAPAFGKIQGDTTSVLGWM